VRGWNICATKGVWKAVVFSRCSQNVKAQREKSNRDMLGVFVRSDGIEQAN